jgi:SAM-dependent methyltransferase
LPKKVFDSTVVLWQTTIQDGDCQLSDILGEEKLKDHTMNYIRANKEAWEEAFENRHETWGTDIVKRIKTEKYPFLEKEMTAILQTYELGDKTIGQFCSNNGRELLSLTRGNAKESIGFDIAENQVDFANRIAKELHSNCKFIAVNALEIGSDYYNRFDLIIITIGALCWFKDLNALFAKVSLCLKENGFLIINEQHPVTNMLGAPGEENYRKELPLNIVNSYFEKEWIENEGIYYIAKKRYNSKTFFSYTHSFEEIMGSICSAGMFITGLHEYDHDISGLFEELNRKGVPLSYILEAKKGRQYVDTDARGI